MTTGSATISSTSMIIAPRSAFCTTASRIVPFYYETIRCCTVVEVGSILVLDDIRGGCFDVAADESFEEGDIGEEIGCSEEGIAAYLVSGQGDIGSEEDIVPSSGPEEGDIVLSVVGLAEV